MIIWLTVSKTGPTIRYSNSKQQPQQTNKQNKTQKERTRKKNLVEKMMREKTKEQRRRSESVTIFLYSIRQTEFFGKMRKKTRIRAMKFNR